MVNKLSDFSGKKYKLISYGTYEDYMKTIEVPLMRRKLIMSLYPVLELSVNSEGLYILTSTYSFKTLTASFKVNTPFFQEIIETDEKVRTVITVDGTTMHEVRTDDDGSETVITRTFTNKEVTEILTDNDTVMRKYEVVN